MQLPLFKHEPANLIQYHGSSESFRLSTLVFNEIKGSCLAQTKSVSQTLVATPAKVWVQSHQPFCRIARSPAGEAAHPVLFLLQLGLKFLAFVDQLLL
jgi:hypothetical protein